MPSGKNYSKITIQSGQKFNRLTALKYEFTKTYGKRNYHYHWSFKCDCGTIFTTSKNSVLKGLTQSCGCLHSEQAAAIYKDIGKRKLVIETSAINKLYASYKHGAESRNYCFEIDKEQFKNIIYKNCYYCDRIPEQIAYNKSKSDSIFYNGIDRVDNNIGYILSNIVTCCKHCNRAKMSLSRNQFLQLIKDIYHNLKLNND